MNLDESTRGEVECLDIEGSFDGCDNQEAALRSVARRVKRDLRYLRQRQYIYTLTIFGAMESVVVSDEGCNREGKLFVIARQKQRRFEILRLWRKSLEPNLSAYIGFWNTQKEYNDDDFVPDTHFAQHRSRLGGPILRVGGDASVVQLGSYKMGGLEPALAEATAAFARTPVFSNTLFATHVTAALPTSAVKRRLGRPKGSKNLTIRAERLESTAQRHREESGKQFSADDALHLAQALGQQ